MALCQLTDTHNNNQPVYINPLHVVAVQRIGESTWVWTNATKDTGKSVVFVVAEAADVATNMLDRSMPRYV